MKKKVSQKPKSRKVIAKRKTIKKSEFYSLKEALNLIGKKIFGDDWLFESSLNKLNPQDQAWSIKTFRTTEELIRNNFFEVRKLSGDMHSPSEQIIFVNEGKINDELKITKPQLDYTLKTGKRFCDQRQEKFPKPLIYRAPFRRDVEEVEAKFNKQEAGKIKDQIRIKDFGYWFKRNELDKEGVCLVLLGINPDYYNFLSSEEKSAIGRSSLFLDDGSVFQLVHIGDFLENFKHIIWQNDWDELIKNLYIKSPILNPTFANRCSKFIDYIKANDLLPKHFDKYLNDELYRPNYDEFFTKEKELEHEDAAFLAMGLEPKYAKQYQDYSDIIGADKDRRYSALVDDEKVFFYKSYWNFLDANFIFIGRKDSIIARSVYDGNLEKFISDLHNKGFLLNEHLAKYLTKKKKFPAYDQDSELYHLISFLSKMRYWSLEDIYGLIMEKNPLDGEQIIFPLGRQCSDGFNVYQSHDKKTYSVLLKSQKFCDIRKIDQFYPKEGEGYKPQDVLEWLMLETRVGMPDLLIDLTFKKNVEGKNSRLIAIRKALKINDAKVAKGGRVPRIPYPKIWKIFITEILEGVFDESDLSCERQAKIAFDNLTKEKQGILRKTAKGNLAHDIIARCQKHGEEIKTTSITERIIKPFADQFPEEFFR
jgi:hypothetical protein